MTVSLAQLQAYRDTLIDVRAKGVRTIQDLNGVRVEFKSDAELAAAINRLDRMIAEAGATVPTTVLFHTSKGVSPCKTSYRRART